MWKLYYMIVGAHRDAFCVDVGERDFVHDVKRAIAKVHKNYQFPANYLKLYLATKDNVWLRDDNDTAERLRNGVATDDMEAMIATKPLMAMLTIRTSLGDEKLRALSKKQIHILVTLPDPAVMLGSADRAFNIAYTRDTLHRTNKPQRFAQAPEVTTLVDKIGRVQCMEDMPFTVLENSSGIGMTQMVFNLMMHGELDARYVVVDPASDSHLQQRVYCAFGVRSTVLKTCATLDLPCVGRGAVSDISSNKQLYAFGFIWAMLSGPRTFTGVKSKEDI
uniref:Crinkler effector protein N-terminal domain-containing protein n=1 Tax=Globisporangium ultimum (strain ATCC 200006 / CBS 805.95 / DAOM BR144) TaxID=431595 RepID=K3X2Q1_GLOUD